MQEIESGSTAVSCVFEGRLRSTLVLPKQRASVTLQPFFTLPLDIQVCRIANGAQMQSPQSDDVDVLSDAFAALMRKEEMNGVNTDRDGKVKQPTYQIHITSSRKPAPSSCHWLRCRRF